MVIYLIFPKGNENYYIGIFIDNDFYFLKNLLFIFKYRCRGELDIMAFLKVYNCLPNVPPRISKHLLDAWDRYSLLKLPKLRSAYSSSIAMAFTAATAILIKLGYCSKHNLELLAIMAFESTRSCVYAHVCLYFLFSNC